MPWKSRRNDEKGPVWVVISGARDVPPQGPVGAALLDRGVEEAEPKEHLPGSRTHLMHLNINIHTYMCMFWIYYILHIIHIHLKIFFLDISYIMPYVPLYTLHLLSSIACMARSWSAACTPGSSDSSPQTTRGRWNWRPWAGCSSGPSAARWSSSGRSAARRWGRLPRASRWATNGSGRPPCPHAVPPPWAPRWASSWAPGGLEEKRRRQRSDVEMYEMYIHIYTYTEKEEKDI